MTKPEAIGMIDDLIIHAGDKLNNWERNFIDSLVNQDRDTISEKQEQKLNQIWDKYIK